MIIKIANRAWHGSTWTDRRAEVDTGVGPLWVELDGHRFDAVVAARVQVGDLDDRGAKLGDTLVTITFAAGAEMVLVDPDGNPIEQVRVE